MFGPRFEYGNSIGGLNKELLSNVTLFADVTNRLVGGRTLGRYSMVMQPCW